MAANNKSSKNNVPKLRHHKATKQAYSVFNGRVVYFGRFDDPDSSQKYHQFVAEWMAGGKTPLAPTDESTITELIAQFWTYAQGYYIHTDGSKTHELTNIKLAMRPLNTIYGHTKATEFGPKALCVVRQKMIEQGICRSSVNKRIGRIKLMFKWAVANEIVPANVFHVLQAVPGLRRGRSAAKETMPVKPVPQEHIDAIQPYVSKQVWVLIQLQLLTAARSGELVIMRPCDIDMSGKIWIYKPAQHKTLHHGHERN
jgi:integrase